MTEIDAVFTGVCGGSHEAFAEWMGRVERPIRLSLAWIARAVDVEGVVQETLMRMWLYAQDRGPDLTGENASLRYAIGMARNIARAEARRMGREVSLPPEEPPDLVVAPDPPADPGLAKAISDCLERVAKRPLAALMARLQMQDLQPDRKIAERLKMTANTFRQNIVRARKQLAECLQGRGVPLKEILG